MPRITARVIALHPTGSMWRAEVQWTREPQTVSLTAEQAEAVTSDPWLEVLVDEPALPLAEVTPNRPKRSRVKH